MKQLAAAFTGPSNSGKTTLILNLSKYLKEKGFKVCIVKHDPADKAIFDKEGKDSYKFSQTGADVAVMSDKRTTIFKKEKSSFEDVAKVFGEFDYLLVEGLKTLPLPRVAVCRNEINEKYFNVSDAIVCDNSISSSDIPSGHERIDLNNIEEIVQWINKNGKKF